MGSVTGADKPLTSIGSIGGVGGTKPITQRPTAPDGVFDRVLDSKLNPSTIDATASSKMGGLKFSQHALERMSSRGITFKPDELSKLTEAIDKAAKKGSRESLVLMGDNALIVSVKNRTVVTAMDRAAMKENVFTNIDSTVIL